MELHLNHELIETRYGAENIEPVSLFRKVAFEVEQNPLSLRQYDHYSVMRYLAEDRESTCFERTKFIEMLSYGDVGVLLASPGPSLAGLVVRELGTPEQQNLFFDHVNQTKARTFLAVTEPNRGSDAGRMETSLIKKDNRYFMSGEKWLVGHGIDGTAGVVIARNGSGPLGITAILMPPNLLNAHGEMQSTARLFRKRLQTIGLEGAQLSQLYFNQLPIDQDYFLGLHLSAMERGMLALIKTFNRMRPCVGAFAIGLAQAVLDYILGCRTRFSLSEANLWHLLNDEVDLSRQMLHECSAAVDHDPLTHSSVSLAKIKATRIAEKIIKLAPDFLGKGCYFEHPYISKWTRDCFGFEYMEGTTAIHQKNIFQGYRQGALK